MRTSVLCLFALLVSVAAAEALNADQAFQITNPPVTLKVQRTGGDAGPAASELRISMTRREYEPVQLVVCAGIDLNAVSVSASGLKGPGGRMIPTDRVTVTPMGFVRCTNQTEGAPLKGDVPDVLLPNRAMAVKAGERQPFFVTVRSLPDDPAGEYRGTVSVSTNGAAGISIPLVVRIYDLTLPKKSHMRTAFVLWGNFDRFLKDRPGDQLDVYMKYAKMMLEYRLSPITMWAPKRAADGNWDLADMDRYLTEMVPLGLTTFNFGGNGEVTSTANADFAKTAAQHLKEKGWYDLSYVYGFDEAVPDAAKMLREKYGALIQALPDIKIMQTGWSPNPGLNGFVKIWCPLTSHADLGAVAGAQNAGEEVWWYVCTAPRAPAANVFVDYPGLDHRILGWQTYKYGIQGFLYWGMDVWENNRLTIAEYDRSNYSQWQPSSTWPNGDGYLLYPGLNDTPVPSVRMALLRDGFEDYDLFKEVEALAVGDADLARWTRDLLKLDAPLIAGVTDYTKRDEALIKRREAILKAGESLRQSGR